MNTTHRSFRPLPAALAQSLQQNGRLGRAQTHAELDGQENGRQGRAQTHAELDGLEVRDSSFDDWLAAGGDRRSQPRVISERSGVTFSFKRG
jgi:hypothetical protein